MSSGNWEENFVVVGQPAWHKLGQNFAEGTHVLAKEAFDYKPYQIVLQPLHTEVEIPAFDPFTGRFGSNVQRLELAQRALLRLPGATWELSNLGIVGPEYVLIDPETVCTIWDIATENAGIETYGVLNGGSELFITRRLDPYDVAGDECVNHLCLHAPFDGKRAYRCFQTPTRIVCENTLVIGIENAGTMFAVRHTADSKAKLVKWLAAMQAEVAERAGKMKEAFTHLAKTAIKVADVDALIAEILPTPKAPRATPDKAENEKREKLHKSQVAGMVARRNRVKVLFEGAGIGMDTVAANGTAWGLFNAVVEDCDHGPANKQRAGAEYDTRAYDALFGVRAEWKEEAYRSLFTYATTGKVPELVTVR